jgi:hypothetical protein
MSELPENIGFTTTTFLNGGHSGLRVTRDRNENVGVELVRIRDGYSSPWIETWFSDQLPDEAFSTYEALRQALR